MAGHNQIGSLLQHSSADADRLPGINCRRVAYAWVQCLQLSDRQAVVRCNQPKGVARFDYIRLLAATTATATAATTGGNHTVTWVTATRFAGIQAERSKDLQVERDSSPRTRGILRRGAAFDAAVDLSNGLAKVPVLHAGGIVYSGGPIPKRNVPGNCVVCLHLVRIVQQSIVTV